MTRHCSVTENSSQYVWPAVWQHPTDGAWLCEVQAPPVRDLRRWVRSCRGWRRPTWYAPFVRMVGASCG